MKKKTSGGPPWIFFGYRDAWDTKPRCYISEPSWSSCSSFPHDKHYRLSTYARPIVTPYTVFPCFVAAMPRDIEANIPNNRSTQSSCTLSPSSKIWEDNGARGLTSGTRLLPIVVYLLDRPSLLTLTLVYDAEGQKDMLLRIRSAANQTMRSHGLLPWWRCMFHAPVIGHAVVEQVSLPLPSGLEHRLITQSRCFPAAILPRRHPASVLA